MADSFRDRLAHAWNAFTRRPAVDDRPEPYNYAAGLTTSRPDRSRIGYGADRTIVAAIYNRIAIDVAAIDIVHARMDENGRYTDTVDSGLQECLTVQANTDQGARMFRQDIAMRLMNRGVVAIVPTDTTTDPTSSNSYDIQKMRAGEIVQWYAKHVGVELYNENTGMVQQITLPKSMVAIVENPLYSVMNEPNSTLQRLTRKLGQLDAIDTQNASGKLDMIIQLPYVIKSDTRKAQAEERRSDLERQVSDSKLGIGYIDGSEKITQLNRPVENNMLDQITYLYGQLYGQLGITQSVFDGTADEPTMLNYYNRTIEPIMAAISEAMIATFLTKTARTQGQSIAFFRNAFALVTTTDLSNMADVFSRNEILSPNEIRGIIGFKPSGDPKSDQLINSNMPQGVGGQGTGLPVAGATPTDPTADPNADPSTTDTSDPTIGDPADDAAVANGFQSEMDKVLQANGLG